MSAPDQVLQLDQKADARLIKKLQAYNKRYRLGLAIQNYPTILKFPSWLEDEELDHWSEIRDRISTLHKTEGCDRIYAALGAYRAWTKGQADHWVHKPRGDKRVLGIPYTHIKQLKTVFQISPHSSARLNKRKIEALSSNIMSDPEIRYPTILEHSSAAIDKPQSSQDSSINPSPLASSNLSHPGSHPEDAVVRPDSDGDGGRKRPRTAAPSDRNGAGTTLPPRFPPREALGYDLPKSAPQVGVSFESASSSRNPSFRHSFADAPEFIDTPATSFDSVLPSNRPNEQEDMMPPPPRLARSIEIPRRSSQRTRYNESPSGSQREFQTTSSLEDALLDAVGQPPQLPSLRSQHRPSDSQASHSTDYYLLEAEASYSAQRRNLQPLPITGVVVEPEPRRTLPLMPTASGETPVSMQPPSREATASVQFTASKPKGSRRNAQSTAASVASSGQQQCPPSTAGSRASSMTRASGRASDPPVDVLFRAGYLPFEKASVDPPKIFEFRALWEATRVTLAREEDPQTIYSAISDNRNNEYDALWSTALAATRSSQISKRSIEKSSTQAWHKATFEAVDVTYSGQLMVEKDGGRLKTKLTLSPLRIDKSCRLSRKFGSDRFFFLDIPRVSEKDGIDEKFRQWLVAGAHRFLGRRWQCIYLKGNTGKDSAFAYQAVLFATRGIDFQNCPKDQIPSIDHMNLGLRYSVSSRQLMNWLLNPPANQKADALKYFSRIGLGFTKTTKSIVFQYDQIAWTRDACSCHPGPRDLQQDRLRHDSTQHSGKVMNDGVGRMSYEAAQQIRRMLDLPELPSAFQGRIAGAKGVWIVDYSGEKHNGHEIWIEITESQHKFDCLTGRENGEDAHRTFEVHSHSHAVSEHNLSYSLISILAHGNVPRDVFETLLYDDFTRMNMKLQAAMDHGGAMMLEWIQTIMPVAADRALNGTVRMTGGFPDSVAEKLIMLAESGHHPRKDRIMADLCIRAIENFYKQRDERLEIGLPKSTNVLMIADPVGVLEPGEIFLQFSRSFEEEGTGELTQYLDNKDVLVARFPAYLPWDIQRVRAVFKQELSQYKDVIIFSVKGEQSLADVLSGGDFDGDKAWVCWEDSLVRPFINTPFQAAPTIATYGIDKKSEKVREVRKRGSRALWQEGVTFNMRPSMLGICANYFNSWTYHRESLGSRRSLLLGSLLGYLVDTAKNGYTFSQQSWQQFLQDEKMELYLGKPAWKIKDGANMASPNSIPDHLRFRVAVDFKRRTLALYKALCDTIGEHDLSLTMILRSEEERAKARGEKEALRAIIQHLAQEFRALYDQYKLVCPSGPESVAGVLSEAERKKKDTSKGKYSPGIQNIRRKFLAIEPPSGCNYYLANEWRDEARVMSSTQEEWQQSQQTISATFGSWTRLKASILVQRHQKRSTFHYTIAGKELCEIKALLSTHPSEVYAITGSIRAALRIDKSFVRRLTSRVPVTAVDDEENDDINSQVGLGLLDD